MTFECRLDPPPDPPIPPEPDPEPPHPNEPPDIDTPPDSGNWAECASAVPHPDALAGPAPLRGARARQRREHGPDAGPVRLGDRHHSSRTSSTGDGRRSRPTRASRPARLGAVDSTEATFRFTGSDNLIPGPYLTFECRLDGEPLDAVRAVRRRRYDATRGLALAGRAHVRGRRDRPAGQRRPDAGRAHVDDQRAADRRDAAGHGDRLRPGPERRCSPSATFTFSSEDHERDVRVQAGRAAPNNEFGALHVAEGVHAAFRSASASSRSARST